MLLRGSCHNWLHNNSLLAIMSLGINCLHLNGLTILVYIIRHYSNLPVILRDVHYLMLSNLRNRLLPHYSLRGLLNWLNHNWLHYLFCLRLILLITWFLLRLWLWLRFFFFLIISLIFLVIWLLLLISNYRNYLLINNFDWLIGLLWDPICLRNSYLLNQVRMA